MNQLFWRKRKAFDRVTAAAERVRTAHGRMLVGKAADVADAEAAHQAAIKDALDEIRRILKEAGEAESPATTIAVQETLQALPGDERPGRLRSR